MGWCLLLHLDLEGGIDFRQGLASSKHWPTASVSQPRLEVLILSSSSLHLQERELHLTGSVPGSYWKKSSSSVHVAAHKTHENVRLMEKCLVKAVQPIAVVRQIL